MTILRTFIYRLRGMFGTARSEKELNSEMCAHLDALTEKNVRRGMTPGDPLTYFGTVFVLIVVSLLACFIPARRTMRVDPLVALRYK
jgi:hypothetical protein